MSWEKKVGEFIYNRELFYTLKARNDKYFAETLFQRGTGDPLGPADLDRILAMRIDLDKMSNYLGEMLRINRLYRKAALIANNRIHPDPRVSFFTSDAAMAGFVAEVSDARVEMERDSFFGVTSTDRRLTPSAVLKYEIQELKTNNGIRSKVLDEAIRARPNADEIRYFLRRLASEYNIMKATQDGIRKVLSTIDKLNARTAPINWDRVNKLRKPFEDRRKTLATLGLAAGGLLLMIVGLFMAVLFIILFFTSFISVGLTLPAATAALVSSMFWISWGVELLLLVSFIGYETAVIAGSTQTHRNVKRIHKSHAHTINRIAKSHV
jgi:hypothetical protein